MTPSTDRRSWQCQLVRLAGELDLGTLAAFEPLLLQATSDPSRPELVVDLRSVTFMDCTPLGSLLRARSRCLAAEGWLRLVYSSPAIGRLLRAVNLTEEFPRYSTIHEARLGRPAARAAFPAVAGGR
jgi:anti-sigma B factor antagonist